MKRTVADLESENASLRELVAELRASQSDLGSGEPYRTLIEASRDAIFVVGRDGRLRYANATAVGLLQRSAEEIIGKTLYDLFPPGIAAHEFASVQHVLDEGVPATSELKMSFPSGEVWQHVSLVPIKDDAEEWAAVFGVARDITDLKRAQEAVVASESRYRALVEAVGDIVFVIGRDDRVDYVNSGAAQWLRSTPDQLIGRSRAELFPEDTDWGRAQADNLRQVLESGRSFYVENVARFPEGSRWQGTSLAPVRDADGRVVGVLGIGRDITKRKHAEEALGATNEELQARLAQIEQLSSQVSALNEMGQMLLSCRSEVEVCEVFASFATRLFPGTSGGLGMRDATGSAIEAVAEWGTLDVLDKVFAPDDCWALRLGHAHFAQGGGVREPHVAMDQVTSALCVPLSAEGRTRGVLTLLSQGEADLTSDILEQHAMSVAEQMALAFANVHLRGELEDQATHDPLTQLYNRRFLDETLTREFHRAARKGDRIAVLMFDVDHFKEFNDECGHAVGDEMLRALAGATRSRLRAEDIACRFGGDEILVVLPGTTAAEAVERAEDIRSLLVAVPMGDGAAPRLALTMSAGVAVFPDDGELPADVIRAADNALYRAKAAGRDRVECAR